MTQHTYDVDVVIESTLRVHATSRENAILTAKTAALRDHTEDDVVVTSVRQVHTTALNDETNVGFVIVDDS